MAENKNSNTAENGSIILELKNIKKYFGGVKALDGVDFKLHKGEIIALLGDNGAGKSTLIKIITGLYTPNMGEIFFEGKKIHSLNPKLAREMGIETIFQDLALVDHLVGHRPHPISHLVGRQQQGDLVDGRHGCQPAAPAEQLVGMGSDGIHVAGKMGRDDGRAVGAVGTQDRKGLIGQPVRPCSTPLYPDQAGRAVEDSGTLSALTYRGLIVSNRACRHSMTSLISNPLRRAMPIMLPC